jgi:hypothetical protein
MYIESFHSTPTGDVTAITAQSFSNKRARVWYIWKTGVHSECSRVVDEIVYGLCICC